MSLTGRDDEEEKNHNMRPANQLVDENLTTSTSLSSNGNPWSIESYCCDNTVAVETHTVPPLFACYDHD